MYYNIICLTLSTNVANNWNNTNTCNIYICSHLKNPIIVPNSFQNRVPCLIHLCQQSHLLSLLLLRKQIHLKSQRDLHHLIVDEMILIKKVVPVSHVLSLQDEAQLHLNLLVPLLVYHRVTHHNPNQKKWRLKNLKKHQIKVEVSAVVFLFFLSLTSIYPCSLSIPMSIHLFYHFFIIPSFHL